MDLARKLIDLPERPGRAGSAHRSGQGRGALRRAGQGQGVIAAVPATAGFGGRFSEAGREAVEACLPCQRRPGSCVPRPAERRHGKPGTGGRSWRASRAHRGFQGEQIVVEGRALELAVGLDDDQIEAGGIGSLLEIEDDVNQRPSVRALKIQGNTIRSNGSSWFSWASTVVLRTRSSN